MLARLGNDLKLSELNWSYCRAFWLDATRRVIDIFSLNNNFFHHLVSQLSGAAGARGASAVHCLWTKNLFLDKTVIRRASRSLKSCKKKTTSRRDLWTKKNLMFWYLNGREKLAKLLVYSLPNRSLKHSRFLLAVELLVLKSVCQKLTPFQT